MEDASLYCPALLGSHCSSRTMDGSLLAPSTNSSRDNLPDGRCSEVLVSKPNVFHHALHIKGYFKWTEKGKPTIAICVHLSKDLLCALFWCGLILWHLHHRGYHLVDSLEIERKQD